ncbi:transmembrane 4 L6 family member 1-like [Arapaima gigas]
MCPRSFTRCQGITLVPLAVCCVVANVLLFFPNGETQYAREWNLTRFVWFFSGIAGGGLLMVFPAAAFMNLGDCDGCCGSQVYGKSCVMLSSVVAALMGLAGSSYCFVTSALALTEGPYCNTTAGWQSPFANQSGAYLTDRSQWSVCQEPLHVVEWNVGLFSVLLALSGVEALICAVQVISGLLGGLCRACCHRNHYSLNA